MSFGRIFVCSVEVCPYSRLMGGLAACRFIARGKGIEYVPEPFVGVEFVASFLSVVTML